MPPVDRQFDAEPDYSQIENRAERRSKRSKAPKKRKAARGFGELLAKSKKEASEVP
jgi:hypothetical protein